MITSTEEWLTRPEMSPLDPSEAHEDLKESTATLALLPARNEIGEEVGGHGESARGDTAWEDVQMECEWISQGRL